MLKDNDKLKQQQEEEEKNEDNINISYKELDEKCDKIILKIKNRKNKNKRS